MVALNAILIVTGSYYGRSSKKMTVDFHAQTSIVFGFSDLQITSHRWNMFLKTTRQRDDGVNVSIGKNE